MGISGPTLGCPNTATVNMLQEFCALSLSYMLFYDRAISCTTVQQCSKDQTNVPLLLMVKLA